MRNQKCKVGVIGAGNISDLYLKNFNEFSNLEVVALASRDQVKARNQAEKYHIPEVCSVEDLLAKPEIELVVNMTPPKLHAPIAKAAFEAGKSVYNEKPLGASRLEGQELVDMARQKGLLLGCAPDNFLGGMLQTARKVLDEGRLGKVVGGNVVVLHAGPDIWHPNPAFFFEEGGGPLLDIGPYYVNALVTLLGPVKRVSGIASIPFSEKIASGGETPGLKIKVLVPTYVAAILEFVDGPIVNLVTTFDAWPGNSPQLEIYGSENVMRLSRASDFGGTVNLRPSLPRSHEGLNRLAQAGTPEWEEVGLIQGYINNERGLGVVDMAATLGYPAEFPTASQPRANGQLAYHVLDIMESIIESASSNRHIELTSTCTRPEPLFP